MLPVAIPDAEISAVRSFSVCYGWTIHTAKVLEVNRKRRPRNMIVCTAFNPQSSLMHSVTRSQTDWHTTVWCQSSVTVRLANKSELTPVCRRLHAGESFRERERERETAAHDKAVRSTNTHHANHSFWQDSPYLQNQFPDSFRQPNPDQSPPPSHHFLHAISPATLSPNLPSITPSL